MTGLFSKDKGTEVVLHVEGMSCMHCVGKVQKGLRELDGVKSADVSLEKKEAKVQFDPAKVSEQSIKDKIAEIGYKVI